MSTQHPEINDCTYRLSTYLTTATAHRLLEPHLAPDETVQVMALGNYDGGRGLLAVTDRRVVFAQEAIAGGASASYAFAQVTSAQWARHGGTGTVTVRTDGSRGDLKRTAIRDGIAVVAAIQARVEEARAGGAGEPGAEETETQEVAGLARGA
jgi:Bacterial PH domain